MWTMTEDDKANARGGVNSPAAREAQAQAAERAAKRRASFQKDQRKVQAK